MRRKKDERKTYLKQISHKKAFKRIISFVLSFSILFGSTPLENISDELRDIDLHFSFFEVAHASNPDVGSKGRITSYEITSIGDLVSLAEKPAADYQYAEITFYNNIEALGNENCSLGSADYPFKGKIIVNQTVGNAYSIVLAKPLFDSIADSVEIVNVNGGGQELKFHRCLEVSEDDQGVTSYAQSGTPLFAANVYHDNDSGASPSTNWNISVESYTDDDGSHDYTYAGLIGTVHSNARVTVKFTNNSSANITGDVGQGNVGLICGTIENDTSVTATISGSNTFYSVVCNDDNGSAGRFAGSMLENSSLTVITDELGFLSNKGTVTAERYAGGVVGHCEKGSVSFVDSNENLLTINAYGNITGNIGAGGYYGYYENASDASFDLTDATIDCTVDGSNIGGLFGELVANADITVENAAIIATGLKTDDTTSNFGGIAGTYKATDLSYALDIDSVSTTLTNDGDVTNYGGAVGSLTDNYPSYIKSNDFKNTVTNCGNATVFGGLIGTAANTYSLIDCGSITLNTKNSKLTGGGIIGKLQNGVLRLTGTTDMTAAKVAVGDNNGQLVGTRDNALVYSVGSGSDTSWTFNRYVAASQEVDDIGTWGEVVRVSADNVSGGTLYFDPESTNHYVTVAKAKTSIDSADDFVSTALNIQLNTSGSHGALQFAGSTGSSSLLLGSISISGTIDLSDTGITGFTRDDGNNKEFTGKLSGSSAKIELATGQYYGGNIGKAELGQGKGEIFRHQYIGLFAKTGKGASFSDVEIAGTVNVAPRKDGFYIGGLAAVVNDGASVTNVDITESMTIDMKNKQEYVGGMFGLVGSNSSNNIELKGNSSSDTLEIKPNITIKGTSADEQYIGGAIGNISSVNTFGIDLANVTVATRLTASRSGADCAAGGLIGRIAGNSGNNTRTVTLNGVTVSGSTLTFTNAESHTGGFLGYAWNNTNVEFAGSGLSVSGTNTLNTSAEYVGGLLRRATGYWAVPSKGISITGMSITGGGTGLSPLILDGYYDTSNAIYLELKARDSYSLGTGLTIPDSTDYDDLVVYSASDVMVNGAGVISISTGDAEYSMDEVTCNGYVNQYHSGQKNNRSRYYYNVGAHKTETTGKWALLNWSLYRYAAANIRSNFENPTLSGDYDLLNVSYYPIDISGTESLSGVNVKFYADSIETTEDIGTDHRLNSDATQHYMMHGGLFRNVTGTLTVSNMTLSGNVMSESKYTGALISGSLSGTASLSSIVINGVTEADASGYLLINKMTGGSLNINDLKATGYPSSNTVPVAKSLIGDVTGNGINLNFKKIKLDGRNDTGKANTALSALTTAYGTSRSIFSTATLLNKFDVDANSSGVYNFSHNDDWKTNRNVTYGQEIITSVENANEQKKYYLDDTYKTKDDVLFVRPDKDPSVSANNANSEYAGFATEFLPYIAPVDSDATAEYGFHELKVNIISEKIDSGCGTYNHPYAISSGSQLESIAKTIRGNTGDWISNLRLPIADVKDDTSLNKLTNSHWCNDKKECEIFTYNDDSNNITYTYTDASGKTYIWNGSQVRKYLASAYYQITRDIELSEDYIGLGVAGNDTTGNYAFRGVIVGKNENVTITNKAKKTASGVSGATNNENTIGLIAISHGSVVKNLKIAVTLSDTDKYNYRSNANAAYAYNDAFPNYGAVINKIMGGDNIIDNVSVTFDEDFKVRNDNDYKATVGGYVGCVVNGGLMFRNVADTDLTKFKVIKVNDNGVLQSADFTGDNGAVDIANEPSGLASGKDLKHIYINRFVGRVINGYVVNETNHYAFSEDGKYAFASDGISEGGTRTSTPTDIVTLHNSRKNYTIPDIDGEGDYNKLTFSQVGGSTYNKVTIPDAQSFAILSMLTQSGSCSATKETGNYKYNVSYGGGDKINFNGYGDSLTNFKATHLSDYENIGEDGITTADTSYIASTNDTINVKNATPYMIYKYTQSYNGNYPARCLTGRTFYMELSGTDTTYYLPDSFRGIGFVGLDKKNHSNQIYNLSMKVFSFDGKSKVIDVNSFLPMYERNNDPYYNTTTKNGDIQNGIALFNRLFMRRVNDNNETTDAKYTDDYIVKDFNITGYISAAGYNTGGTKYYPAKGNNFQDSHNKFYTTGGLVAYHSDNDRANARFYNFAGINFNDLTIDSTSCAGAFIPFIQDGMIFINNCNATNLTVMGSGRTGGFIGTADGSQNGYISGLHINANVSNAKTELKNINIIQTKESGDDNRSQYVGGIIGSYWGHQIPGYKSSNNKVTGTKDEFGNLSSFIFKNITITSDNTAGSYIGNKKSYGKVGGIIGNDEKSMGCVILNCKIEKTNIQGAVTGGILGSTHLDLQGDTATTDYARFRVVNCEVSGDKDEQGIPKYTITGNRFAGGVVGYDGDDKTDFSPIFNHQTYQYKIDGCYVHDYNITMSAVDDYASYGVAGLLGGSEVNNSTIVNSKVDNCIITDKTSKENRGLGGIIGYANKDNGLKGFNIVISNNKLQNTAVSDDTKIGNLIGFAVEDTFTIQIAGYARKDNKQINGSETVDVTYDIGRATGTDQMPSGYGSSYLVYADYTGKSFDIPWSFTEKQKVSGLKASGTTNVSSMGAAPYATVKPIDGMGTGEFITGDGAVLSTNGIIAKAIVNGTDYSIFSDDDQTKVQAMLNADSDANIRLTTYETELGEGSAPNGVDIPVISISDTMNYKDYFNAYAHVITNTPSDKDYFESADNTNYGFDILRCQFIDGKYQVITGNSGITYDNINKTLKMNSAAADTSQENSQITVIDLKFYDPAVANSKEVVYHVYIPVLTKKMIRFDFKSAVVSDTEYVRSLYESKFGNSTAENFDNWITMFVQFGYYKKDLQDSLDSGVGLYWNNEKSVRLTYTMHDSAQDSEYVLIDPNGNRDTAYYAEKGRDTAAVSTSYVNNYAVDTLSFNKFRDKDGNPTFKTVYLNDLVKLEYSTTADSSRLVYTEADPETDAAVICAYAYDSNGKNLKYFKPATEDNGTYALNIVTNESGENPIVAKEQYYISMFTESQDNEDKAYKFTIQSPRTLSGRSTSLILTSQISTLLLGDLFKQENLSLSDLNTNEIMNSSNNYLTATVSSTISFIDSPNVEYVKGDITSSTSVFKLYQGFVLRLNRIGTNGRPSSEQQINGEPSVTFSDNSLLWVNDNAPFIASPVKEVSVSEINSNGSVTVQETYRIEFKADDDVIAKEFPSRSTNDDNSRIHISVFSNLAYNDNSKVAYSSKGNSVTNESIGYYMSLTQEAALDLEAVSQLDQYDKYGLQSGNTSTLGINAKYLEENVDAETIQADIRFDMSRYPNINAANKVVFSIGLEQKQDSETNVNGVYKSVDLNDYLNNVMLLDDSGSTEIGEFTSGNQNTLTFTKDNNGNWTAEFGDKTVELDYYPDMKMFTAVLMFDVKTGDELKKINGYLFSNYKITLNAQLYTGDDLFAEKSYASDTLVYTNAKINAEFVNAS